MKKQTAVDWFYEKLIRGKFTGKDTIEFLYETTKEIERNQILEAYREGRTDQQSTIDKWNERTSAEYFNQTYGGSK
jgi:hypothetical protein